MRPPTAMSSTPTFTLPPSSCSPSAPFPKLGARISNIHKLALPPQSATHWECDHELYMRGSTSFPLPESPYVPFHGRECSKTQAKTIRARWPKKPYILKTYHAFVYRRTIALSVLGYLSPSLRIRISLFGHLRLFAPFALSQSIRSQVHNVDRVLERREGSDGVEKPARPTEGLNEARGNVAFRRSQLQFARFRLEGTFFPPLCHPLRTHLLSFPIVSASLVPFFRSSSSLYARVSLLARPLRIHTDDHGLFVYIFFSVSLSLQ
ncbi:hypothetical protein NMY22_g8509 [Coprinellus aureogranulatus]|nr:hypothetical protein NMY22_g8509 [Coprinellus aureogranulatus]